MNKRTGKSVTLIELIISVIVVSIMVLSFYSLVTYGYRQVINADRRANVQNNLAYCLEHMGKYVQQAGGNINTNYPAITLYPTAPGPKTGFQIRVDFNTPQTPSNSADDALVYYTLSGNTLNTGCAGTCGSFLAEALSTKIVANFNNSVLPVIPLYGASDGFYVFVDPLGNFVDVGLVGRYYPSQAITLETRFTNPQVVMKTRLICNNSSSN